MSELDKPLQCPICGDAMRRYDTRDKWRCAKCNGVLVGWEQLVVEIGDELRSDLVDGAGDPSRAAARPCPVCVYPMSPVAIAGLELERCENDAVVWFDGGEIGKLRTLLAEASVEEPVVMRLRDAVIEVQQLEAELAAGVHDEIPDAAEDPTPAWDDRKLCSDGSCNGVIGDTGVCGVCGKAA